MATGAPLKLKPRKRKEGKCRLRFATERERKGWIIKYKVHWCRRVCLCTHLHLYPYKYNFQVYTLLGNICIVHKVSKIQNRVFIQHQNLKLFILFIILLVPVTSPPLWIERSLLPPLSLVTKPPNEPSSNISPDNTSEICSSKDRTLPR